MPGQEDRQPEHAHAEPEQAHAQLEQANVRPLFPVRRAMRALPMNGSTRIQAASWAFRRVYNQYIGAKEALYATSSTRPTRKRGRPDPYVLVIKAKRRGVSRAAVGAGATSLPSSSPARQPRQRRERVPCKYGRVCPGPHGHVLTRSVVHGSSGHGNNLFADWVACERRARITRENPVERGEVQWSVGGEKKEPPLFLNRNRDPKGRYCYAAFESDVVDESGIAARELGDRVPRSVLEALSEDGVLQGKKGRSKTNERKKHTPRATKTRVSERQRKKRKEERKKEKKRRKKEKKRQEAEARAKKADDARRKETVGEGAMEVEETEQNGRMGIEVAENEQRSRTTRGSGDIATHAVVDDTEEGGHSEGTQEDNGGVLQQVSDMPTVDAVEVLAEHDAEQLSLEERDSEPEEKSSARRTTLSPSSIGRGRRRRGGANNGAVNATRDETSAELTDSIQFGSRGGASKQPSPTATRRRGGRGRGQGVLPTRTSPRPLRSISHEVDEEPALVAEQRSTRRTRRSVSREPDEEPLSLAEHPFRPRRSVSREADDVLVLQRREPRTLQRGQREKEDEEALNGGVLARGAARSRHTSILDLVRRALETDGDADDGVDMTPCSQVSRNVAWLFHEPRFDPRSHDVADGVPARPSVFQWALHSEFERGVHRAAQRATVRHVPALPPQVQRRIKR